MTQERPNGAPPKWRRRKSARPGEIISAALEIFADHGFAAAKLDDIASRAGVAKGSIYLYFSTKEELFRAVVRSAVVPGLAPIRAVAESFDGPLSDVVPRLLAGVSAVMDQPRLMSFVRIVIGESRNFPDIAAIWHDEVVGPVIDDFSRVMARAQADGGMVPGDYRLQVFSIVGPLFMAMLFRDVFGQVVSQPPDLARLAELHGRTVLRGLLIEPST
jgi:AcrR family transcriptional regulator